jgi:hypothetical protein
MVSSEGACAAYYSFGRYSRARERERVLASGEPANGHVHAGERETGVRPVPVRER